MKRVSVRPLGYNKAIYIPLCGFIIAGLWNTSGDQSLARDSSIKWQTYKSNRQCGRDDFHIRFCKYKTFRWLFYALLAQANNHVRFYNNFLFHFCSVRFFDNAYIDLDDCLVIVRLKFPSV